MELRLRRTPPARLLQQLITSENVSGVNVALLFTISLHSRSSNENAIRTSTESVVQVAAVAEGVVDMVVVVLVTDMVGVLVDRDVVDMVGVVDMVVVE